MATNTSNSVTSTSMGVRIKELRKKASISQQELGNTVGVSRAAISLFEIGTSKPSSETLSKLADALQVDMAYLLGKNQVSVASISKFSNEDSSEAAVVELPFLSVQTRSLLLRLKEETQHIVTSTLHLSVQDAESINNYTDAVIIEVGEDNMEPLLHLGDKVIAWPVQEVEWEQLYNQVCVVAYKDTVTIKAIRENELLTRDLLTLHAQNSIAGFLPIQRQQIRAIWRVEEFFDRPKIRL